MHVELEKIIVQCKRRIYFNWHHFDYSLNELVVFLVCLLISVKCFFLVNDFSDCHNI